MTTDQAYFEELFERLDKLEKNVQELTESLKVLRATIDNDVKPNCSRMEGHIDFVEKVYKNVRSPMYFICNKINRFTGGTRIEP